MTNNNQDTDIIREMIGSHFGIRSDLVQLESVLIDDLGADSLDSVEITLEVEREFDIEIPDEEIDNIKTVQDIVNLVQDLK